MLNEPVKAWAVTYKGNIPYTSEEIFGGERAIYQIYTNKEDAEQFCRVPFSDAEYEVTPVIINNPAQLEESK